MAEKTNAFHIHPQHTYAHTYSGTVKSEKKKLESTYWDGTDPTRLRANHSAHWAHATVDMVIKNKLGNLCGLSTSCLPTHNHDTVRVDQLHQLLRTEGWEAQHGYKMRHQFSEESVRFILKRTVLIYEMKNKPLSSHRMVISPWISKDKNKQILANTEKKINTFKRTVNKTVSYKRHEWLFCSWREKQR